MIDPKQLNISAADITYFKRTNFLIATISFTALLCFSAFVSSLIFAINGRCPSLVPLCTFGGTFFLLYFSITIYLTMEAHFKEKNISLRHLRIITLS